MSMPNPTVLPDLQKRCFAAQHCALLVLFAAIPFPRALFNSALFVAILFWLLSSNKSARAVFTNPLSLLAIFLTLWVFVGAFYGTDPRPHLGDLLSQYAPWLLIPMLVSQGKQLDHRSYLCAFAAGATLLALLVAVSPWVTIPFARSDYHPKGPSGLFYHYISQSVVIAILANFYFWKSLSASKKSVRLIALLGFFLLSWLILYGNESRTGHIALVAGFSILAIHYTNKQTFRIIVPVALLVLTVFAASDVVQDRMKTAVQELKEYENTNNYTSIGARVRMWDISLDAIQERPWLGHGSRSYGDLSKHIFDDDRMCAIGCLHPHNQFLLFGVENGSIGLLAFVAFAMAFGVTAFRARSHCGILVCVAVIFLVVSLFDSSLNYIAFIHIFVPFVALTALLAEQARNPRSDRGADATMARVDTHESAPSPLPP